MSKPIPVVRPMTTGRRSPTVMDSIVLVAGVAIGAGWLRAVQPALARNASRIVVGNPPKLLGVALDFAYHKIAWPYEQVFPFIAGLMIAMLVLRFLAPKPRRRILIGQRGWTACLAATIIFAIQWTFLGLIWLYLKLFMSIPLTNQLISEILGNYGLDTGFFDPGPAVLAVWITQAVVRRSRGDADWIDRSGRLLGWCCIAGTVVRVGLSNLLGLHYRGFFPP